MLKYKIPQIVTLTHVFYVYFAMCQKKNPCKVLIYRDFFVLQFFPAERRGFEPRVPRSTTVFKTAAIDHSATSPKLPFRSAFVESVAKVRLYFKYARLLNKKN